MDGEARGDARQRMSIDPRFPQQLASRRIDRVGVAANVAEERGRLRRPSLDDGYRRRAAQPRLRLERPVHATGGRIERIEISRIGTDEDPAIDDCRLPIRRRRPRQSERPSQFQPRNRSRRKPMPSQVFSRSRLSGPEASGRLRRLVAIVLRHVRAPSVPGRRG